MADFGGDLEAFRAEARAWLEANFPPSLKGKRGIDDVEDGRPRRRRHRGLEQGAWARRAGARRPGRSNMAAAAFRAAQARVLQQEMSRIGAWNPIGGMGVMMFGPTLLEYGNEEQKQRHIPRHRPGSEVRWCQGYLRARRRLRPRLAATKAEDKGDHFLVNGQKIWTSGAQFADWCFCLVRTDNTKKHEGICFLLIDMKIAGRRSAADQADRRHLAVLRDLLHRREGAEGKPGRAAQRRLDHRQAPAAVSSAAASAAAAAAAAAACSASAARSTSRQDLCRRGRQGPHRRRRPARAHHRPSRWTPSAFQLTALRARWPKSKSNQGPSAATSIMKNAGTKIGQERAELILEIMGHQGLGWEGEGFTRENSIRRARLARRQGHHDLSAARRKSRTTSSPSASLACSIINNDHRTEGTNTWQS